MNAQHTPGNYVYRITYMGQPLPGVTKNIEKALRRLKERREANNDICSCRIQYRNTEFKMPWLVL